MIERGGGDGVTGRVRYFADMEKKEKFAADKRQRERRGRDDTLTLFQEEQTACRPPFPQRTSLPTAAPSWECTHTHTHTNTYIQPGCLVGGGVPRDAGRRRGIVMERGREDLRWSNEEGMQLERGGRERQGGKEANDGMWGKKGTNREEERRRTG